MGRIFKFFFLGSVAVVGVIILFIVAFFDFYPVYKIVRDDIGKWIANNTDYYDQSVAEVPYTYHEDEAIIGFTHSLQPSEAPIYWLSDTKILFAGYEGKTRPNTVKDADYADVNLKRLFTWEIGRKSEVYSDKGWTGAKGEYCGLKDYIFYYSKAIKIKEISGTNYVFYVNEGRPGAEVEQGINATYVEYVTDGLFVSHKSSGKSKAYLLSDGELKLIGKGVFDAPKASPDGCKVAFNYMRSRNEARYVNQGRGYRPAVIDFCNVDGQES